MNALRLVSRRTSPARRCFASASAGPAPPMPKPPVPEMYHYSFRKAWLSDSSTYPLLFSLTVAAAFTAGMTANAFLYYKDLKITSGPKSEIMRSWGNEKTVTFTEAMASKDYHTNPEGLGVDHAEWVKAKRASGN